jgi:competence protein ComEC
MPPSTTTRRPSIARAPLAPVAIALAGGILLGRYLPAPLGLWALLMAAGVVAAAATVRREHLARLTAAALLTGVAGLGAASACLAYWRLPGEHVAWFSLRGNVPVTVRGRVASVPRIRRARTAYWLPPKTTFPLRVEAIRDADGRWRPGRGRLHVSAGEPAWELRAGDEVELVGLISRPRPPGNPGQYDWAAAARNEGILARMSVPGVDGVRILDRGTERAAGPLRRIRGRLRRHFATCGDREDGLLLTALVLGERDPALRDLNQSMVEAGVAHLLSISGMHLGIFLALVYLLCRALTLSPPRSAAVVLAAVIGYVLLAEPRAPLMRGALMAGALAVAVISGRRVTPINALAAAAILLLLLSPLSLLRPGFQLSFGIVLGIIVLYRPLKRALFGWYLGRRGMMVFGPGQRPRRWLHWRGAELGINAVCVALAAHLAAAPLVAFHFGLFTPYAAPLSMLLMPLMWLILAPAYASMALAPLAPNLAAAIGEGAAAPAGWLQSAVELLGHLPGRSIDLYPVPAWWVLLAFATLAAFAFAVGRRRAWAAGPAGLAILLLAATAWTQRPAPPPDHPRLHVLAVGHGSMALLHATDGRTYLFDAGTLASLDAYQQVLRPFLRARRLPPPRVAFLSHANVDHYNALPGLLARDRVERVYLNPCFGRRRQVAGGVRELMAKLEEAGVRVERLAAGDAVDLCPGLRTAILWPPAEACEELTINESSLVMRIESGDRRALIPGDIGPVAQEALMEAAPDGTDPPAALRADVLIMPHHGSSAGPVKAFIDAVAPAVLIQSSSSRHEPPELLEAVAGRRRFTTNRHGWICAELRPSGVEVRTMRGRADGAGGSR